MIIKLMVANLIIIFCANLFGNETKTDFKILRQDGRNYILAVNPEIDYFINGEFKVESKIYKILDSNNANDTILVQSDSDNSLPEKCLEQACRGEAVFYEEFSKKQETTKNKNQKSIFLGGGKTLSNDLHIEKVPVKSYGGISLTSDLVIVNFALNSMRLGIGVGSTILHTSFQNLGAPYFDEFGNEMVDIISISLSPTIFIFPFQHFGFFASPLINYSMIPYTFEEAGHKQKYTGGIAFGTCFGALVIIGDLSLSFRLQNSVTKMKSEYSFTEDQKVVDTYMTKYNVQVSSAIISVGINF